MPSGGLTDGFILIAPVAITLNSPSPMVVVNPNESNPDYLAVIANNRDGAMELMAYLTSLGHKRIGFIGGRKERKSTVRLLQGYKNGLTRAGISWDEDLVEIGDYTAVTGKACAHKLLSLPNPPTCVIPANQINQRIVFIPYFAGFYLGNQATSCWNRIANSMPAAF